MLQLCMITALGVSVCLILRSTKSDFVPLVRVAFLVILGIFAIGMCSPLIEYLGELGSNAALLGHAPVLFKALGVAILTELCSQITRDCGEGTLSQGVEAVGKIQILLLCLPLIKELLSLAVGLLEWGEG
ncbi:MAG: hypothetical protein IKC31_05215 [Clostridia bacterium]|nr:hypothetical protein [Clostridia bacterium]MBR2926955.1 hypothetical protein [Clostridia bacterium]